MTGINLNSYNNTCPRSMLDSMLPTTISEVPPVVPVSQDPMAAVQGTDTPPLQLAASPNSEPTTMDNPPWLRDMLTNSNHSSLSGPERMFLYSIACRVNRNYQWYNDCSQGALERGKWIDDRGVLPFTVNNIMQRVLPIQETWAYDKRKVPTDTWTTYEKPAYRPLCSSVDISARRHEDGSVHIRTLCNLSGVRQGLRLVDNVQISDDKITHSSSLENLLPYKGLVSPPSFSITCDKTDEANTCKVTWKNLDDKHTRMSDPKTVDGEEITELFNSQEIQILRLAGKSVKSKRNDVYSPQFRAATAVVAVFTAVCCIQNAVDELSGIPLDSTSTETAKRVGRAGLWALGAIGSAYSSYLQLQHLGVAL